jgi:hypothetical protein
MNKDKRTERKRVMSIVDLNGHCEPLFSAAASSNQSIIAPTADVSVFSIQYSLRHSSTAGTTLYNLLAAAVRSSRFIVTPTSSTAVMNRHNVQYARSVLLPHPRKQIPVYKAHSKMLNVHILNRRWSITWNSQHVN